MSKILLLYLIIATLGKIQISETTVFECKDLILQKFCQNYDGCLQSPERNHFGDHFFSKYCQSCGFCEGIDDEICKVLDLDDCKAQSIKKVCPQMCSRSPDDAFCKDLDLYYCEEPVIKKHCSQHCSAAIFGNSTRANIPSIANEPTQTTIPVATKDLTTQRPLQTRVELGKYPDCGANNKKPLWQRIVGGRPADPKDWPWMAALLKKRGKREQYCGGTLITDRHVLTAAHCLLTFSKKDIRVCLGEYDFKTSKDDDPADFDVVDIRRHAKYDKNTYENDIAILKLDRPSTFNQFVRPICLPPVGKEFEKFKGYVIGWGKIKAGGPVSSVLQEVMVSVWSQNDCNKAYRGRIKSTMMCAGYKSGGKDSCQGDSGGPFLLQDFTTRRWYVAGIISWGIGCAAPNKPAVLTRVNNYLDWIRENTVSP